MVDFPVQEIDAVTAAFPANVKDLMPAWDDIPKEFKDFHNEWNEKGATWFYQGVGKGSTIKAKKGIDEKKALRHLGAILGSWEPKHEHKMAAVGYLMSQWFDKFAIKPAKPL